MIYWQLFLSYFQIGLFSFGGGYACMPLIEHEMIHVHHWITLAQFTDITAISQITPGPIALNMASFVGMQIAGVLGACVAVIGCIMPSCLILAVLIASYHYFREQALAKSILLCLSWSMIALITASAATLMCFAFWQVNSLSEDIVLSHTDWIAGAIFITTLFVLRNFKRVTPTAMMLICGVVGFVAYNTF